MILVEGQIVRVRGVRGLFRAVEPVKDLSGSGAWWFLPAGEETGWRAFHPKRCRPHKEKTW